MHLSLSHLELNWIEFFIEFFIVIVTSTTKWNIFKTFIFLKNVDTDSIGTLSKLITRMRCVCSLLVNAHVKCLHEQPPGHKCTQWGDHFPVWWQKCWNKNWGGILGMEGTEYLCSFVFFLTIDLDRRWTFLID